MNMTLKKKKEICFWKDRLKKLRKGNALLAYIS